MCFELSSNFHVNLLWHENSSYTIEQWIPLPLVPHLSEPTQDFPHLPEYLPCDLDALINAAVLECLHVLVVFRPLCFGERVSDPQPKISKVKTPPQRHFSLRYR